MRKEADLDLLDRIEVAYESEDPTLCAVIDRHGEYIQGETQCVKLYAGHCETNKEVAFSGKMIRLALQKVPAK